MLSRSHMEQSVFWLDHLDEIDPTTEVNLQYFQDRYSHAGLRLPRISDAMHRPGGKEGSLFKDPSSSIGTTISGDTLKPRLYLNLHSAPIDPWMKGWTCLIKTKVTVCRCCIPEEPCMNSLLVGRAIVGYHRGVTRRLILISIAIGPWVTHSCHHYDSNTFVTRLSGW